MHATIWLFQKTNATMFLPNFTRFHILYADFKEKYSIIKIIIGDELKNKNIVNS